MKTGLMIAWLITGVLVVSAGAQESSTAPTTNTAMARLGRPQPTNAKVHPTETPVPPRDAEEYPKHGSGSGEDTIVVDVWSSATEPDPAKLSRGFAVAALSVASRMQLTQRKIANSIKMGFPLGEFWIHTDLDSIDDSLRVAALSATNEADQQALQELQIQTNRLRSWCDWLIDQNRHMRLAEYYINASALDNDERFQDSVACNQFLLSMLASGKFEEGRSCR